MLYIEHLTKTFGEKKAVDDLSLHIAPGEIYGFIGHNGAGKTTTLKSVVGIQQFDSGRITIGGHSIQDDPIACKKMLAEKTIKPCPVCGKVFYNADPAVETCSDECERVHENVKHLQWMKENFHSAPISGG